MAISKDKKNELVADLTELLSNAKATVFAKYQGLTVAELQELRKMARESGVKIKVVKNRLVKVAMKEIAAYKDTDASGLTGQLLYALGTDEDFDCVGLRCNPYLKVARVLRHHNLHEQVDHSHDDGQTQHERDEHRDGYESRARASAPRRPVRK